MMMRPKKATQSEAKQKIRGPRDSQIVTIAKRRMSWELAQDPSTTTAKKLR